MSEDTNAVEEKKAIDFKIEDAKLIIKVDPNKDGQAVVELNVDLAEVADEIIDAIKK